MAFRQCLIASVVCLVPAVTPAMADAQVSGPPRQSLATDAPIVKPANAIWLRFRERIARGTSVVVVNNATGSLVPTLPPSVARFDATQIVVPLQARLAPGSYTVMWWLVSADERWLSGRLTFRQA